MNLLRRWGIFPAAVVGHSSGEIAAAYTCSAINTAAAITIAYYRGQVTKEQTRLGGMAAVGMGREKVLPYIVAGVVIACENSPTSVTISGDKKQLNNVVNSILDEQPDIFVRRLNVEIAYHSRKFRLADRNHLYRYRRANAY